MKNFLDYQFKRNSDNLFILHDKSTFWKFFKILRKNNYKPGEALNFIFTNCCLSALVFQECIYNNKYKEI
jgi:hypothetical protein